jgi:hypothetical protein
MKKTGSIKFTVMVVSGAVAALIVLGAWLVHPAMEEVGEAGKWFLRLLMPVVVVTAMLLLIFRRNTNL